MAFGLKVGGGSSPASVKAKPEKDKKDKKDKKKKKGKKGKKGRPNFMMRGKAAARAFQSEEKRAEARAGTWRFWIGKDRYGEEHVVTFLDGEINDEGMLDCPQWYEHKISVGGRWDTFPCVADEGPCPMCVSGNNPSYVGALTIVDHTKYKLKPRQGETKKRTVQHRKRLFVMPRRVIKIMTKFAKKHDGLTGLTFSITRTGEQANRVGDVFMVEEKNDLDEMAAYLKGELGKDYKREIVQPVDYDAEIPYFTAEELIAMGVGEQNETVGREKGLGKARREM